MALAAAAASWPAGGVSTSRRCLGSYFKGDSFPCSDLHAFSSGPVVRFPHDGKKKGFVIEAAWTRRSKGALEEHKGRKSWRQRHEKFMKPFILDVFISHKYVHAKVVHRLTSKVVAVATTNAKDLRYSLYSLTDENACKTIGTLLAERSIEADVYAVTFGLRKGEKFEGKLATVVNTLIENGVALV